LTCVFSSYGEYLAKPKRLKRDQEVIQKSMEVTSAVETRRIKERDVGIERINQQNKRKFIPLGTELFKVLYIGTLAFTVCFLDYEVLHFLHICALTKLGRRVK